MRSAKMLFVPDEFANVKMTFGAKWELKKFIFKLKFYERYSRAKEPSNITVDLLEYLRESLNKVKPGQVITATELAVQTRKMGDLTEAYQSKEVRFFYKIWVAFKVVGSSIANNIQRIAQVGLLLSVITIITQIVYLSSVSDIGMNYYEIRLLEKIFPEASVVSDMVFYFTLLLFSIELLVVLFFYLLAASKPYKLIYVTVMGIILLMLIGTTFAFSRSGSYVNQNLILEATSDQIKFMIYSNHWVDVQVVPSNEVKADEINIHMNYSTKTSNRFVVPNISSTEIDGVQTIVLQVVENVGYGSMGYDYVGIIIEVPRNIYVLSTVAQERSSYPILNLRTDNMTFQYHEQEKVYLDYWLTDTNYYDSNTNDKSSMCLDGLINSGIEGSCAQGTVMFGKPADLQIDEVYSLEMIIEDGSLLLTRK